MGDSISLFVRDIGDPVEQAKAFVECLRPLENRDGRVDVSLSHWRGGTVREERAPDGDGVIRSYFERIPRHTSACLEVYLHTDHEGDGVPVSLHVRGEDVRPGPHEQHAGISFREKKDWWGTRNLLSGRTLDFSIVREIGAAFIQRTTPGTAWLCDEGEPIMPSTCYLLYHRDPAAFDDDARLILERFRNQHTKQRIFVEWLEASAHSLGAPEDFESLARAAAGALRDPDRPLLDPSRAAKVARNVEVLPTTEGLLLAGNPFFKHHVAGLFTSMLQGTTP